MHVGFRRPCCDHNGLQERRQFDQRFAMLNTRRLCELTSSADALEMRSVVDVASRALARLIEGRSPEEIRAVFNLPDDLTEEEKMEPLRNLEDDPRVRCSAPLATTFEWSKACCCLAEGLLLVQLR